MLLAPLALVIAAAFIHATWNLLSKQAASAGPTFVCVSNLISCIAYAPWAIWLLARDGMSWSWLVAGFIVLSAVVHLAYTLSLQRGYLVADLSVVYPVARGTGPLLSSVGAFLLLGELPTSLGIAGLIAVIIGIGLISTQGNLAAFRKRTGFAGVLWGTATGFLTAIYTVVDAYAVKSLGIAPVVLNWTANLLRFALLAPLILKNPNRARKKMTGYWRLAIAVGLLQPLAYILVLIALHLGAPVSVVAPAREMSMMVGAFLGMIVLREQVGLWRLVGCAVMILGVIALVGSG
jgi:drug/metabolite transporter (DMT)-like permease